MDNQKQHSGADRLIAQATTPFMLQICSETKDALIQQVEHLAKMAGHDDNSLDERQRFANMLDGARTVLNIIEDSGLGKQGTDNWLKKMDLVQLRYCLERTETLIKRKEGEGRVTIYQCSAARETKCFLSEIKANEWVMEVMKRVAGGGPTSRYIAEEPSPTKLTRRIMEFGVSIVKVIRSELNDYLEGDDCVPQALLDDPDAFNAYYASIKNKDEQMINQYASE